jgi:hypothetical protein
LVLADLDVDADRLEPHHVLVAHELPNVARVGAKEGPLRPLLAD